MNAIQDWWLTFWSHEHFWDAFWPSVWGAVVGALAAFYLEHRRRKAERNRREVGECNKLIFILGQMLSFLEDANDSMFELPTKKLGRRPKWEEIGALVGAPDRGPEFIIGEYTFLLENEGPDDRAPDVLNDIYRVEGNFKALLGRLHLRNALWYDYSERRSVSQFMRGESGVAERAQAEALGKRINELTIWLEEDLRDSIAGLQKLMPQLRAALKVRFPGRSFIEFLSKHDPRLAESTAQNSGERL
jgi:hypothetical protein